MGKELIISVLGDVVRVALISEGLLIEYIEESSKNKMSVGDVYLGRVKSLSSGMNACFVEIGSARDAFLHYSDLGLHLDSVVDFLQEIKNTDNIEEKKDLEYLTLCPERDKLGTIDIAVKQNQELMVQIKKEPMHTKGARLASEISLAGRYMILIAFSDGVNISKKITNIEERKRLKRLVSSIKPKNFGAVIRTVAEGKEANELTEDLNRLLASWYECVANLPNAKVGRKLLGEASRVSTVLRDVLKPSFDKIVVDNPKIYEETHKYLLEIAPEKIDILSLFSEKVKLFEKFNVEKNIKLLFGRTVSLDEGGYLIIEHTEAMHVIDVNSGSRSMQDAAQNESILKINLSAAKEVARQLRLRDMGGIVVVDFIDMKTPEHRTILQDKMQEYLNDDRSKTKMLPISKFGLMQITRQRVRQEMTINTQERCSACNGSGETKSTLTVTDDIEKHIDFFFKGQNESKLVLHVHPYIYLIFTKGFFSACLKWFFKYKSWVTVMQDSTLAITEYRFFDKNQEEIVLSK